MNRYEIENYQNIAEIADVLKKLLTEIKSLNKNLENLKEKS